MLTSQNCQAWLQRHSLQHQSSAVGSWWHDKNLKSDVTWAHLVEKIPEFFLSLHNLLPVFYLLVFYMLLLQPATHTHARARWGSAYLTFTCLFNGRACAGKIYHHLPHESLCSVTLITLTVWPPPAPDPEKQVCCWGSWSPAGGWGRRWPPAICWTLAPPSHLFLLAPGHTHTQPHHEDVSLTNDTCDKSIKICRKFWWNRKSMPDSSEANDILSMSVCDLWEDFFFFLQILTEDLKLRKEHVKWVKWYLHLCIVHPLDVHQKMEEEGVEKSRRDREREHIKWPQL